MNLKQKRQKAIDLIDDIFGDTSVSKETTLEHLEEILDAVEGKVDLLRSEITMADTTPRRSAVDG